MCQPAAHIHHEAAFTDGGVIVRFRFPGLSKDESLQLGFVDRETKGIHAGHLCYAILSQSTLTLKDSKTGEMNLAIRKQRAEATANKAKPFDYRGFKLATAAQAFYSERADEVAPLGGQQFAWLQIHQQIREPSHLEVRHPAQDVICRDLVGVGQAGCPGRLAPQGPPQAASEGRNGLFVWCPHDET